MTTVPDHLGWIVCELMGHRRLAGYAREVEVAGAKFLRLDVATAQTRDESGPFGGCQLYSAGAIDCITPTNLETVIQAATINSVAPVTRWELPAAREAITPRRSGIEAYDDVVPARDGEDGPGDEIDDLSDDSLDRALDDRLDSPSYD